MFFTLMAEIIEFIGYSAYLSTTDFHTLGYNVWAISDHLWDMDVNYEMQTGRYFIRYEYADKLLTCNTYDTLQIVKTLQFQILAGCFLGSSIMCIFTNLYHRKYGQMPSITKIMGVTILISILTLGVTLITIGFHTLHHRIYFEYGVLPQLNRQILDRLQQEQYSWIKYCFQSFEKIVEKPLKIFTPFKYLMIPQHYGYQIHHHCMVSNL